MGRDLFEHFIELYGHGNYTEAMQLLIPHPDVEYETLHSKEKFFPYIVNFADSCVFQGSLAFQHTQRVLESSVLQNEKYQITLNTVISKIKDDALMERCFRLENQENEFFEQLPKLKKHFFALLNEGCLLNEKTLKECLEEFPAEEREFFEKKFQMQKGIEILKQARPDFCKGADVAHWKYRVPLIPFSYALSPKSWIPSASNEVPLIFLEPIHGFSYDEYLRPFLGKKMILAFETVYHLFQMFQFPSIHRFVEDPSVVFYLLESFPEEQFSAQSWHLDKTDKVQPQFMIERKNWGEALTAFTKAFNHYASDRDYSRHLYEVAKRALFNMQALRYGKSRFVAFSAEDRMQGWFNDSSLKRLSPELDLGPEKIDYLKEIIEEKKALRTARSFAPDHKIRLAHVVPQIVDGGHAPTRLLKVLCSNADRIWFDLKVFSTERMVDHALSYPVCSYISDSTFNRAKNTLNILNQIGISAFLDSNTLSYEMSVENISEGLSAQKIDIAVFHGADDLNELISASCDVPIRILFEHGSLPAHGCFDLLVLSTEEAYQQNQERFHRMGMESCYLPFSLDSREGWLDKPLSRQELALPEEAFVMTTISHHLKSRLSPEMCEAISEILVRCPQAYYAPMGEMEDPSKFTAIFEKHGVQSRVKFLGSRKFPSQVARSMHLYLNEFPFGSGLGILDAMAAGCPVISMYDENGPQQSRYAATYFGIDYVVKSCKRQDYVNLACSLYENPQKYKEWSQHALKMYEQRVNLEQYVDRFEKIIEFFIDFWKGRQDK